MNPAEFRLLIHHHDVAYVDEQGAIWLSAFIGRWVTALADHFRQIGLLLHQSSTKLPKQDTPIHVPNVKLHSFGNPGKYIDHFSRIRRIRHVCSLASANYDGLLVRGMTPRQATVWESTAVNRKAYLLVGSLLNFEKTGGSLRSNFVRMIKAARARGFAKIIREKPLILVNFADGVSDFQKMYSQTAYFVPTNSIRRQEFSDLIVKPLHNPVQLLYVGRMDLKKGLRELIQSLALLNEEGIQTQLQLVASRREPEQAILESLAKQLGVSDQISWRGFIPYGKDLFACYRQADFFVLPSYTEGFPHVLWEAAGNCCAIITTDVGGIPALLHNKIHAVQVKPQSAIDICQAVKLLIENPEMRMSLILQAYELAKNYTVEACAEQLADRLGTSWS